MTGIDLFTDKIVLGSSSEASLTNTNLDVIDANDPTNEDGIAISGGNATFADGYEVWIVDANTYAPGGDVTADDFEIRGTGAFNAAANGVTISGDYTAAAGSVLTSTGTFTFDGSSAQTVVTGGTDGDHTFGAVTHSGSADLTLSTNGMTVTGVITNSGAGDFDTGGLAVTAGGISVTDGTFNTDARAGTWDIGTSGVSISASKTLTATSGTMTVEGDFTDAGTFTHNSGTVTFDGSATSTLNAPAGGTTFYDLTCITASKQLTFTSSDTFTVSDDCTLDGQAGGTMVKIRASSAGTAANLVLNGTFSGDYVDVRDNSASGTVSTPLDPTNSVDSGNTTNWFTATPTSEAYTLRLGADRHTFYDGTNYWLFYLNAASDVAYKKSSDGSDWSGAATLVDEGSYNSLGLWEDDTSIFLAYSDGTDDYCRTITISDGSIGTERTLTTTGHYHPQIVESSDDYLWRKGEAIPGSPAWYNASWLYRQKITIQSSQVEANLNDFPVFIEYTDPDLTDAKSAGEDFRITTSDGTTEIPIEVEDFNDTTGYVALFTKVNVQSGSDVDLYLYYGNSGASAYAVGDPCGAQNVWDSNFVMVQHFK